MKESIFFVIVFIILNGCAQYSSLIGSSYTLAKSGSILQTGTVYATSYGIKKTTGLSPGEHIQTLVSKNYKIDSFLVQKESITDLVQKESIAECQKTHTSSLNKVFFDTLDQINCLRNPFGIFK